MSTRSEFGLGVAIAYGAAAPQYAFHPIVSPYVLHRWRRDVSDQIQDRRVVSFDVTLVDRLGVRYPIAQQPHRVQSPVQVATSARVIRERVTQRRTPKRGLIVTALSEQCDPETEVQLGDHG